MDNLDTTRREWSVKKKVSYELVSWRVLSEASINFLQHRKHEWRMNFGCLYA